MKENKIFRAKIKTRWLLATFILVWAIGCLAMISVLAVGAFEHPSRHVETMAICAILFIAALIASNYFRWQLKGCENLQFKEDCIELYKTGTWFTNRLRLGYQEIEKIDLDKNGDVPHWRLFYGVGGGSITLVYFGRKKRFGQDLSDRETQAMLVEIREELAKRKACFLASQNETSDKI